MERELIFTLHNANRKGKYSTELEITSIVIRVVKFRKKCHEKSKFLYHINRIMHTHCLPLLKDNNMLHFIEHVPYKSSLKIFLDFKPRKFFSDIHFQMNNHRAKVALYSSDLVTIIQYLCWYKAKDSKLQGKLLQGHERLHLYGKGIFTAAVFIMVL